MAAVARAESATSAGVRVLAARYDLGDPAVEQLLALLRLLAEDPQAPTAITGPRRILDDHLADSLVSLELECVRDAGSLVDLGSGAGVPALPLAIALPQASVTLVESSSRKCAFIARAVGACGLDNVELVHARAEAWPEGIGGSELATARALAPLEVVVEYAAPLLRLGGTLVAWRGKRDSEAEAAATVAAEAVGMAPGPIVAVTPYPGARNRHLHVMSKVMETPKGFPRRPGLAQKRPLSGLSTRAGAQSDRDQR
jgi:16S rRNA (guanine527-N7)-methyltransferase